MASKKHFQHHLTSRQVMPKSILFRINVELLLINTKDLMIQVIRPFLIYAVVVDLHFVVVQDHFLHEQLDHQSRLLFQSLSDELLDIRLGELYFILGFLHQNLSLGNLQRRFQFLNAFAWWSL